MQLAPAPPPASTQAATPSSRQPLVHAVCQKTPSSLVCQLELTFCGGRARYKRPATAMPRSPGEEEEGGESFRL